MSTEAKVLYGLLLDHMGLPVCNDWIDNDGWVYICFTQGDAMTLMSCSKDKATKLFQELDPGDTGLIECRKQGQGRPAWIDIKKLHLAAENGPDTARTEAVLYTQCSSDCEKSAVCYWKAAGQDSSISVPAIVQTELNDTDLSIFLWFCTREENKISPKID